MSAFLFRFGNGHYDEQCAVVIAETLDAARALLVADLEGRGHIKRNHGCDDSHVIPGQPYRYYHAIESLEEAEGRDAHGVEIASNIIYTYGVDG